MKPRIDRVISTWHDDQRGLVGQASYRYFGSVIYLYFNEKRDILPITKSYRSNRLHTAIHNINQYNGCAAVLWGAGKDELAPGRASLAKVEEGHR